MGRLDVTVDASTLTEPSGDRGIGTYLRAVLTGLVDHPDLALTALIGPGGVLPEGVTPRRISRVAPGRFRALEHEWRLPLDLRRAGGDVVWSPGQDPPRSSTAPFVQTLLDATPLVLPDPSYENVAQRMRRLLPRWRAAAAWIAISHYSADSCAEVMDLPRDRIAVAHLAAHPRFTPGLAPSPRPADEPYVVYVGEYGPNKGFAEAFAVAGELAARGLPHRVKMVGRLAPWWRPTVDGLLAASPRPDRVELAGFVDDLVATYRGATALIMTSRHEGFGLPLVEAMACAVPVVAFDNSSLPEVVGDGGVVVPDADVPAMVDALVPLLTDDAARASASDRALARSTAFDWAVTADRHAEVLRAAAQR